MTWAVTGAPASAEVNSPLGNGAPSEDCDTLEVLQFLSGPVTESQLLPFGWAAALEGRKPLGDQAASRVDFSVRY